MRGPLSMKQNLSNVMLESLPSTQRASLLARLQPIALPVGTVLCHSGEQPNHVHFITSGMVSVVSFMANGTGVEVGLVGRDGIVEGINLLGPATPPTTSFVQVEATALRMDFSDLKRGLFTSGALLQRILESVQRHAFIANQLAACNGLHEIQERLARWLLMVQDLLECERFYLTQEFLSEMLGTRRTSVSGAAAELQQRGWIEYRRGNIRIVDRRGLEAAACECYPIVRDLSAHPTD